jgi:hypothetical protein
MSEQGFTAGSSLRRAASWVLTASSLAVPGMAASPSQAPQAPSATTPAKLHAGPRGVELQGVAGGNVALPLQGARDLGLTTDARGDHWVAASEESGPGIRLRLFTVAADGRSGKRSASEIPNPAGAPGAGGSLQLSPVWITTAKQPVLAWLEGHDIQKLAVRSATWDGTRWIKPRLVTPAGPGSQMALVGTTFEGKPMLAWAAFDGHDDEILWSRWDGRRWTPAHRVAADDSSPDVTPTLVTIRGGVVVAWAGLEGDSYRVQTARFEGSGWSLPTSLGNRAGASPRFLATPRGAVLLARSSAPSSGLTVFEFDERGAPTGRSARAADPPAVRLSPRSFEAMAVDAGGLSLVGGEGDVLELPWDAANGDAAGAANSSGAPHGSH